MTNAWHLAWNQGQLVAPDGRPCLPVWGETCDLSVAHEAVDTWAATSDLIEQLPATGAFSTWWFLRYYVVNIILVRMLPQLRALQGLRARMGTALPERIVLQAPPEVWWPSLVAAVFPEATVSVKGSSTQSFLKKTSQVAGRAARAWVGRGEIRRRSKARRARPRALIISQSRYWADGRDTLYGALPEALKAQGFDVCHMVQSQNESRLPWAEATRLPPGAFPGDGLYWRHLLRHGWEAPAISSLHTAPLVFEGMDIAPILAPLLQVKGREIARQQSVYIDGMPDLIKRLGIRLMILLDENGGESAVKLGALAAGIPVLAVQHGCIHPDHLHYIYPKTARGDEIPLCDHTCVHGQAYADLLCETSMYPRDQVSVVGRLAQDDKRWAQRPWMTRDTDAETLRKSVLPPTATRLLLFTSQDLYADLLGPTLLDALAKSAKENFLVIRPHPRESDQGYWRAAIRARGLEARVLIRSDDSVSTWLDACDAHLSGCSTALGEAVLCGRPNIVVCAAAVGDWMGVLAAGLAVDLEQAGGLDAALHEWATRPPEAIQSTRARYISDHFGPRDPSTVNTVAHLAREIVSRS